jgi:hypothetical protein
MLGVPETIRAMVMPVDRLGGVPLVRVTRPTDRHAKMEAARRLCEERAFLQKRGLWGVSGDPNFSDFWTLYVANSGYTISIGEVNVCAWAGCVLLCVLFGV